MDITILSTISETPNSSPSIWENILGILISGFIALIIFTMGLFFENNKRKTKKRKELKAYEKYFSFQLTDLYKSANNQVKSIINFLRLLKQEKEQDLHFKAITSFNPQNILAIDKEKLFSLMVLKRKGNQTDKVNLYSNLINSIILLSHCKDTIFNCFNDLNTKSQNYVNHYKHHLEKIARTMEDFGTEVEMKQTNIVEDEFLNKYQGIINNLIKDEEYKDIHKSYSKLIQPMHKLCSDKKIVHGDFRANIIIKDVMQAKYYFDNYINTKRVYLNEFCNQARLINSQIIKIQLLYNALIVNKIKK